MYLLTDWIGWTGKYLAPRSWRTDLAQRPTLTQSTSFFIIHEHLEDEVWTKKLQICTENVSALFVFAFLALNNLDVILSLKSHHIIIILYLTT